MSSPDDTSSLGKDYDDGVYEKVVEVESQSSHYNPAHGAREQPPKLPTLMLASLVVLLISCFVGILLSGLHFGNTVHSGDCLGQSWVMFASLLGLLYLSLHLQAARKGEPVIRKQPCSMNPLYSATIVIARLDAVAWAVALIVVSVAVSKDPSPLECMNLVACTAVTPTILFILGIDEKAKRPFDLPYLSPPISPPSSIITCRVSDFVTAMPDSEVTVEDSISRRGSNHSATSSSSHSQRRPNSHTEHAAAIAAANSASAVGGGLGGPRPPPKHANVKEAHGRPWGGFGGFDDRTKKELAASVTEASQASDARVRIGGPRALALSDKARQTGVLPPPVCLEPKFERQPAGKENAAEKNLPSPTVPGGWRNDWGNLSAETGYNSTSTTPASTPSMGPPTPGIGSIGSVRAASRSLSPVAEVDDRRYSAAARAAAASSRAQVARPTPQYSYSSPSSPTTITTTSGASHNRYINQPRSQNPSSSYTYATAPPPRPQQGGYSYEAARAVPRPPPPAATAPAPARIRLARAQEAMRLRGGARDTVVLLNRPRRLTGDRRPVGDQRSVVSAPAGRPEMRMPGSFE